MMTLTPVKQTPKKLRETRDNTVRRVICPERRVCPTRDESNNTRDSHVGRETTDERGETRQ